MELALRLTISLAACAALALAACDAPADDSAVDPGEAAAAADDNAGSVSDDSATAPAPEPAETDSGDSNSVPVAIRGRWALVPADCTSTRGDAKGLIEIGANQVKFYESVATLGTVKERGTGRIRADWSFIGEGMTWSRDMSMSVLGDQLIRREFGEGAMDQALTYTKCG